MRTLRQVERELAEAQAIVDNADRIGPSYDNEGNEVMTAAQRIASAVRRVERLTAELDRLKGLLS
jgi:inactivated superfamily I helicase